MRLIIAVTLAVLTAAFAVFFCFSCLWSQYEGLGSNIASELLGLAISIPIIYLIVEKAIDKDRRLKWLPARQSLFNSLYRKTQSTLSLFAFIYGKVPALELFNNADLAVQETKRVSDEVLAKMDWSVLPGQLDNLIVSLDYQVASLLSTVRSNQNILSDDPVIFKQAFDVEAKMDSLSAIASFKSFPQGIREITPQQGAKITECMRALISSLVELLDTVKRQL